MTGKELGNRPAFPTSEYDHKRGISRWQLAAIVMMAARCTKHADSNKHAAVQACLDADALFEEWARRAAEAEGG